MSISYIFKAGGPIILIIIAVSFIATVLIIERFIYLNKLKKDQKKAFEKLKERLLKGEYSEAQVVCDTLKSPLSSVVDAGIKNIHLEHIAMKELMLSAANGEVSKIERFVGAIGTIANIAPLLGLLGTVTGNIKAFGVLSHSAGAPDPSLLALGISEALLTTAAGIMVGIPAVIFYNILISRVNNQITELESNTIELSYFIKEK